MWIDGMLYGLWPHNHMGRVADSSSSRHLLQMGSFTALVLLISYPEVGWLQSKEVKICVYQSIFVSMEL
jgi:hypothetical protein